MEYRQRQIQDTRPGDQTFSSYKILNVSKFEKTAYLFLQIISIYTNDRCC